jgi:transposase
VTALYSLLAATAAERLGLTPRLAHLDSTRVHVDGRYNSDEEPAPQVIHLTRGDSRDQRPDLNQVLLELMVAHQAGIPLLMPPLSGHSRDTQEVGQVIRASIEQWHTTYGAPDLVAARALYSAANLHKLAQTAMTGMTRVPTTVREAQAALAQVDLQALASRQEGDRDHESTSTYGGLAQRWVLIYAERRQPQAQRTVDRQLRQQRDEEVTAWKKFCGPTFACEAEARQALAPFEQALQATVVGASTVRATARYGQRGRPGQGAQPDQVVYHLAGAFASSLAARQALIGQHRCFILATNALDTTHLPPPEVWAGYQGQGHVERGCRLLKAPQCFASSLYLKKPDRIMAL